MSRHPLQQTPEDGGWLSGFLRELIAMPRRHMIVFLLATVLLILLEVDLTEGWHLIHILEVLGGMLFLYLFGPRGGRNGTGDETGGSVKHAKIREAQNPLPLVVFALFRHHASNEIKIRSPHSSSHRCVVRSFSNGY